MGPKLMHPAVLLLPCQARASEDYALVTPDLNAIVIGGSSLLMGAAHIAPSKDTLWTSSPQPVTASDKEHSGYSVQPHVTLDAVLAVLSMGPVGISDALNYTNVSLIAQTYMSASDGTLLRPSRPLSWPDSVLYNMSHNASYQDIRITHAAVSSSPQGNPSFISYYVVAWATQHDVWLGGTDLFPTLSSLQVAVRPHVFDNNTAHVGCVDGQPAVPSCVSFANGGTDVLIPATGTDVSDMSLTAVYTQACGGVYFLGELAKIVHVSPQRFSYVACGGNGPSGLLIGVIGTSNQLIHLISIDARGIVHTIDVVIPFVGFVEVEM